MRRRRCFSARPCGRVPEKAKDLDLVNAVLWSDRRQPRLSAGARAPQWWDAYTAYVAERGDIVERFLSGIGAAQGIGAVHAVDIHRLLPIVREAKARALDDGPLTSHLGAKHREEAEGPRSPGADPVGALEETGFADPRAHAGRSRIFRDRRCHYRRRQRGHTQGLVKVSDLAALAARNDAAKSWDATGVATVEKLLIDADGATGITRLILVGSDVGPDLALIADYLEATSDWIDAGLREAASDGGAVTDLDSEIEATIATWLQILQDPEGDGTDSSHHLTPRDRDPTRRGDIGERRREDEANA